MDLTPDRAFITSTLVDLVRKIGTICGKEVKITEDFERVRPENSEVERLCCDNRKIIENTDWRPRFNLEQGLKATIKWIGEHLNRYKTNLYQK